MMLENKRIVVVGAAGLLGAALVEAILEAGANVVALDVSIEDMKQRLNSLNNSISDNSIIYERVDITSNKEVKSFFEKYDNLDGAVNCAYPRNKSYGKNFLDVTLDSFNENVSLQLGSTFLFSQQCVVYFNEHKSPFNLVNLSSIYGVVAPKFEIYEGTTMTMPVEYAAVKSAIIHLNKYISSYVSNSSFRINSVSPGGILDKQPDLFVKNYKSYTNGIGMLGVKDVLGAIIFLLSESSQYINGQNLVVDDGFCI